jgi:transposase
MAQVGVLGIDVASRKLVVYDTATGKHHSIENSEHAISKACIQLHWSPEQYVVGLESTGDYSLAVMKTFFELGFQVRLLNPILTQGAIKRTVRGTKTDATDSELIAELTSKGEGQLVTESTVNIERKATLRVERKLSSMESDLKRLLKSVQKKQEAGEPMHTAERAVETLLTQFETVKAELWSELTTGHTAHPLARQEEILNSHIGCGVKLSTIISEEAGDITRFESPRQLIAYAGIDPKVKQSGDMDTRGRMTKRGNPNLRHALYLAASVAARFDPELKDYFEKKKSEGKHYTVAVCAVARKMCERIYSTIKHNRLYEKREVVKEPKLSTETALDLR